MNTTNTHAITIYKDKLSVAIPHSTILTILQPGSSSTLACIAVYNWYEIIINIGIKFELKAQYLQCSLKKLNYQINLKIN